MTNNESAPPLDAESEEFAWLLTLYQTTFETLRHEGNGTWERFNIIVGINVALFTAFALLTLSSSRPAQWGLFAFFLSLGGVLTDGWSLFVNWRLWERHPHWGHAEDASAA